MERLDKESIDLSFNGLLKKSEILVDRVLYITPIIGPFGTLKLGRENLLCFASMMF